MTMPPLVNGMGFPEESEKFCTPDEIALINHYLWALSTNAG
jgi:hypothetical protein